MSSFRKSEIKWPRGWRAHPWVNSRNSTLIPQGFFMLSMLLFQYLIQLPKVTIALSARHGQQSPQNMFSLLLFSQYFSPNFSLIDGWPAQVYISQLLLQLSVPSDHVLVNGMSKKVILATYRLCVPHYSPFHWSEYGYNDENRSTHLRL